MKNKLILVIVMLAAVTGFSQGSVKGVITTDAGKEKYKANTIVYIETAGGTFAPPKAHPIIDQKDLTFVPHVLTVLAGTTVDFLNSDNVLHNVFSPDKCCEKFNLGSYPKGEKHSTTFKNAGCQSVILCNVHPEMEAYIIVVQNPYFAKTDKNGNFEIKNVPAGDYTLKVWNEKYKADNQKIKVTASGATAGFKLKK